MSRYIDADKLMITLNDWWYSQTKIESQNIPYDDNISVTIREAMEAVKEQPTADVRENVRGEWIEDKKTEEEYQLMFTKVWKCSRCGEQQCRLIASNFCPNCGAEMIRGEHDE